jgi:hypothetical protein
MPERLLPPLFTNERIRVFPHYSCLVQTSSTLTRRQRIVLMNVPGRLASYLQKWHLIPIPLSAIYHPFDPLPDGRLAC